MYQYLSCGEKQSTTFRALYRGYNHWGSGRVEKIEININDPFYCFVRCCVVPSIKTGIYTFIKEGFHRVWRNTHGQLSVYCWVSIMFLMHIFHHNFCLRLSATCVHRRVHTMKVMCIESELICIVCVLTECALTTIHIECAFSQSTSIGGLKSV